MSTSSDKVFEEHDIHSISAIESVKTLFSKLCQSLFIKLIILMLSLYFGGLIWFFYSHSTSWTQLLHLCHQSSTEFISTAYYDMSEYSPLFFLTSSRNHHHTIHHHTNDHSINNNKCDADDNILNCEMQRQGQKIRTGDRKKNRDNCIKNVRDENFNRIQVDIERVNKHKGHSLNELLKDINDNYLVSSLSMELNSHEANREFPNEIKYCETQTAQFLTDFAPVLGFHVLCFQHFPQYQQSLVIAFMNGYKNKTLPSIPYKNRQKCIVRSIVDENDVNNNNNNWNSNNENNENNKRNPYNHHYNQRGSHYLERNSYHELSSSSNGDGLLSNESYYVTNECQKVRTSKQSNPKYLLITMKSMKDLRRHLQNYLINDIGSFDQYTIEGHDIKHHIERDNNHKKYPILDPTQSPETEKLYDLLEFSRQTRKRDNKLQETQERARHKRTTHIEDDNVYSSDEYSQPFNPYDNDDNNNKSKIITQYRKNPFGLYYPNGESVSYYLKHKYLFNIKSIVFMFEGGRFMWPGVERGHIITLPIGPDIHLETINMRPLLFEIHGLITKGEVEYIRNKSLSRFNRSEVGLNEDKKISESRTCESAWLFGEKDLIVNSLKNRCERIIQIPKTHMEDMEVVRYKIGQRFDLHYDAFQHHDAIRSTSQTLLHAGFKNRIATILYYLSNVDDGGYTVFPRYDDNLQFDENGIEKHIQDIILSEKCNDISDGLRIKPKSGKTILFYNMLPNGELDPAALHGGCTLNKGQKWAANQWIWNRPFWNK